MDLEIQEALAFAEDRDSALGHLLPGTEDHDYFRCIRAQHLGALDDADEILRAWPERHGHTPRYDRLRLRQLLYQVTSEPARAADDVRDWFGVNHWHEAEVEAVDPSRPTRLPDGAFTGEALLESAVQHDSALTQVTDEGLIELLDRASDRPLDPARRRVLIGRIHHTSHPGLARLVAEELAALGASGFGSLAAHARLTLDQLHAIAAQLPDLRGQQKWVAAVVRRMRPPERVDLDGDLDARGAFLDELWRFVGALPPSNNTLKAHVAWHLLDTRRRRGLAVDPDLLETYLALPRVAPYAPRERIDAVRPQEIAELGANLGETTGLPPAPPDEELVRALLFELAAEGGALDRFAPWLDTAWFAAERASATLLLGAPDADRATRVLGPARAAALRDRIELAWCATAPVRFAADQPVALDVDVKNVGELVVQVFRVDPIAYFHGRRREIDTSVDLDGLAASHELVIPIAEPPIRRVRRRIELPMCTRPGTYVIDLIGNGMSSRALITKGGLRHVERLGAAGHVVTILDETGAPRPDARAFLGEREYVPDERGAFVIPFSTAPARTPMLLACGELATVAYLELERESYELELALVLDREALAAGRTATALARVKLSVADAPASLALLRQPSWEVTLTDRHGVSTTRSQPLELSDDDAAVLAWPLGPEVAHVAIAVRGTVEVRSEQREQPLVASHAVAVATIHDTAGIEALYLARTAAGWVISALGKTGEPRARRPVTVALTHRWARTQLNVELATDERGRIELGALPGVESIAATLGALTQRWSTGEAQLADTLHATEGDVVVVPVPPARTTGEVLRRASLVEMRGGAPARHPAIEIEALEGGIAIRGLPAGDYELRAPGVYVGIAVAADGPAIAGWRIDPGEVLEVPRPVPVVERIGALDEAGIEIALRGASSRTRVHAIATRFGSSLVAPPPLGLARAPRRRLDRARRSTYVSGRELGDEYRYVLERRAAKRYPSLQLDKPSLLLNPWARRTSTSAIAVARPGEAFRGGAAPTMARAAYGGGGPRAEAAIDDRAFASHDFLPEPPGVVANLVPDRDGVVRVPRSAIGAATELTIFVDDPIGGSVRRAALPEAPLAPRDLRLRHALDPARHVAQHKAIEPLATGQQLVIEDLATAQVHLLDSVERAHGYLLALRDDATLREFAFVTRWHELPDAERRRLYSKYACHELHLFLFHKDRAFFDGVVRPYLAHKRTPTFVDHWLLGADLAPWLEPSQLARLNAVERALLAQRLAADDALPRILDDQIALEPPDPAADARLIDALLGAATLERPRALAEAQEVANLALEEPLKIGGPPPAPAPAGAPAAKPDLAKRRAKGRPAALREAADEVEDLAADLRQREVERPHYRAAEQTQEWAENNWWRRLPAESGADLIPPSRLWRDLAHHRAGSFLSPWLGLATGSFAEAMCALAVTDLPFVPGAHQFVHEPPRLAITAGAAALAGSAQLVDRALAPSGAPLVVGTSYVRADDRYEWSSGEQVDKYVEGPLATGVVYTCLVVLANPTSSRQRIAALVQIPRGSLPVANARVTHTLDVLLEPYGTHGHEYSFYFPEPGSWTHYPVHVSRGGQIVAAAPAHTLEVTTGGGGADPRSWSHVSQRGTLAEVTTYLATANLAATPLARAAWRMRDRAAYDAILGVLERRRAYDATLWAYALYHRDGSRIRAWLRALGTPLLAAGPVLEVLGLDAEQLGGYEHLELAPLINARAHRLGPKHRILDEGLAAQYARFLELVAHRPAPTAEDLLAAAMYLMAQDRFDPALAALARVDAGALADRMQHDYLAAFVACLAGELDRARALADRWTDHPVDRWRHRFGALRAMLDELAGAAPAILDPHSRDQQQAELAARQPTFEIAVDRDGIEIRSQHVQALELRLFEMDIELLFSRQPFVQSDVSRFSFIEPGYREQLRDLPPVHRVAWPAGLRGKNVVVEAVGAGQRKAAVHYANELATQLANQVGQLRVVGTADRQALPATYIKVYARMRGGAVAFYKDGYTDLRGWFDYASLSTGELDRVERFAILVCSDRAGAAILETAPPVR